MDYLYSGIHVWYGNEVLTPQSNVILTPTWAGNSNDDRGLVHGDLNNDGYDDVIGSSPLAWGQSGAFRIWLGGANMNGTSDLTVNGSYIGMLMGTAMAAGDFNGDGCCDVAAGAPHSSAFDGSPGRVYVYAGNTQLADSTVANEDYSEVVVPDKWSFKVIPNPVHGNQSWKLKFTGRGYDKYKAITVKIYNLKGQRINSVVISNPQLKSGEAWLPNHKLAAGIYEISLYDESVLLKSRKATIK